MQGCTAEALLSVMEFHLPNAQSAHNSPLSVWVEGGGRKAVKNGRGLLRFKRKKERFRNVMLMMLYEC